MGTGRITPHPDPIAVDVELAREAAQISQRRLHIVQLRGERRLQRMPILQGRDGQAMVDDRLEQGTRRPLRDIDVSVVPHVRATMDPQHNGRRLRLHRSVHIQQQRTESRYQRIRQAGEVLGAVWIDQTPVADRRPEPFRLPVERIIHAPIMPAPRELGQARLLQHPHSRRGPNARRAWPDCVSNRADALCADTRGVSWPSPTSRWKVGTCDHSRCS